MFTRTLIPVFFPEAPEMILFTMKSSKFTA
jgi:hypothetical protein